MFPRLAGWQVGRLAGSQVGFVGGPGPWLSCCAPRKKDQHDPGGWAGLAAPGKQQDGIGLWGRGAGGNTLLGSPIASALDLGLDLGLLFAANLALPLPAYAACLPVPWRMPRE